MLKLARFPAQFRAKAAGSKDKEGRHHGTTNQKLSPAEMSAAKYNRMVESSSAESQLNKIAKSPSLKGGLSNNDIYNPGSQIDMYKKYEAYVTEENSSASSLGMLPNVALDLITAQYALSIATAHFCANH